VCVSEREGERERVRERAGERERHRERERERDRQTERETERERQRGASIVPPLPLYIDIKIFFKKRPRGTSWRTIARFVYSASIVVVHRTTKKNLH